MNRTSTALSFLLRPSYVYEPLPPNGYIRLMLLQPGSGKLRCSIVVQRLEDSALSYEALSYVWGPQNHPKLLLCDGKTLAIGRGLASALRALRSHDKIRRLWVDAVCINQADHDERAQQVSIMGNIFSNAITVLVWVGEDTRGEAERCFEFIREARQAVDSLLLRYGSTDAMPDLSGAEVSICRHEAQWAMVKRLMGSEWFERVWMLQEVGLARSANIHYGRATLPLIDFVELMCFKALRRDLFDFSHNIDLGSGRILNAFSQIWQSFDNPVTWRDELPWIRHHSLGGRVGHTFVDVLASGRDYKATDERDHVYAFLGHPSAVIEIRNSSDRQLIVDPDYQISVDEVHLRVASRILETHASGWNILTSVDHVPNSASLDGKRPSWVARWDEGRSVSRLGSPRRWYQAGGDSRVFGAHMTVHRSLQCLRLDILMLDKVDWISQPFDYWKLGLDQLQTRYLREVFEVLEQRNVVGPYGDTRDGRELAFGLSLVAGLTANGDPAEDRLEWQRVVFETYKSLREQIWKADSPGSRGTNLLNAEQRDSKSVDISFGNARLHAALYVENQRMALHCRRVFHTSKGFYGIGHQETKVEDECVIVPGCSVPLVLRPVEIDELPHSQQQFIFSHNGKYGRRAYRLVGEAYIQGVMRGEIMAAFASGTNAELSKSQVIIV
jgi:hypothetical protein